MDKVARLDNRPGTYHIVTLGCQMNARDSETIAGMLEKMGMRAAPTAGRGGSGAVQHLLRAGKRGKQGPG